MSVFHSDANRLPPGTPDVFRRAFIRLGDMEDKISALLPAYNNGFVDNPLTAVPLNPVLPPQCPFEVDGIDGKFEITVTLPQNTQPATTAIFRQLIAANQNSLLSPMVHQAQSATNLLFDAAGNVTNYDLGANLTFEVQDPNQTKFWRLRSSFDGQNWNAWKIFTSAAACGPIGVQSGFQRSTSIAPRSVLNTNNATANSIDAGSSATIRLFGPGGVGSSYTRFDGQGNQITTAAATILGASYTTQYAIVLNAQLVHQAFPSATQYLQTIADALFYIATLTTVAAGGGGGSTGGGGTSGGAGGGRYPGL